MSDDAAVISRYLLHDLPAPEREEVERRYFSDPDYLELVDAVEGDLIDAYVRGELAGAEREQFERHFLCTRARRERLRLAEALLEHVPQRRSWRREWIALAASLVLLAGLAAWLWPRQSVETAAPGRREARVDGRGRPSLHRSITLVPGLTRDGDAPQRVVVEPGVDAVQIDALVEVEGEWRDLRASLRTSEGREVWSAKGLSLDATRTVRIAIPASHLKPGEYMLVVSSGVEVVGDYFFLIAP